MKAEDELDQGITDWLSAMQNVPPRKAEKAAAGRAAFLQQAQAMKPAVSAQKKMRLNGWIVSLQSFISRKKEQSPMFSTLATIVIIVSLLLGGGGVTVAAAQAALPDQPLYALKTWTEEARLGLTGDPQAEWQLALQFAERRMLELQRMVEGERPVPETLPARYQQQIERAIRAALGLPEEQAQAAMQQIRDRLRLQEQTMTQLHALAGTPAEPVLLRTMQMIQARIQWLEDGLQAPRQWQEHFRLNYPQEELPPAGKQTQQNRGESGGYGPGDGECQDCTPAGTGQGGNPWTTGTPTPGAGYGEGNGGNPWTSDTPTPGAGYGDGQGGNPWTDATPTPGSGYGPGDGPKETCPAAGCGPGDPTQPGAGNGSGKGY